MKKEIQALQNLYIMTWSEAQTLTWKIREIMQQEEHQDATFNTLLDEVDEEANQIKEAEIKRDKNDATPRTIQAEKKEVRIQLKALYMVLEAKMLMLNEGNEEHSRLLKAFQDIFGDGSWSRPGVDEMLSLTGRALGVLETRGAELGVENIQRGLSVAYEALRARQRVRESFERIKVSKDNLQVSLWRIIGYITVFYARPEHARLFEVLSSSILAFNARLSR
ncbi:hypothetical protein KKB55_22635 [Myxococcota bacterium]|nr:hypothetical protein [Myxococcota bacterium]MBU1900552.1 hypothetical protein [Myxococcota bacterium]